jgi:phosphoribosylformimino-5-aminoimidazole carboxamide ribotide isomerase
MRFRPCIDLHDGKVKQIVGSSLSDEEKPATNFESSYPAAYYAEIYRADNLTGGHVIMLGPGNTDEAINALQAFPGGLQAGGGINPENAHLYLDAGASHVIVTSYVFQNGNIRWDRLDEIIKAVGKDHLVLDLSCKKKDGEYIAVTDRWQKETETKLSAGLFNKLSNYCDEFLIHAAHVEGMRKGIDAELVSLLSKCAVQPVTYAGGVSSFNDLEIIKAEGMGLIDVTIGSALSLFGGEMDYREVVEWFKKNDKSNTF